MMVLLAYVFLVIGSDDSQSARQELRESLETQRVVWDNLGEPTVHTRYLAYRLAPLTRIATPAVAAKPVTPAPKKAEPPKSKPESTIQKTASTVSAPPPVVTRDRSDIKRERYDQRHRDKTNANRSKVSQRQGRTKISRHTGWTRGY